MLVGNGIIQGGTAMKNITDYITPDSCSSIPELFLARVSKSPNDIAYRYCNKMFEKWHTTSWQEMAKRSAARKPEKRRQGSSHAAKLSGMDSF
jgi:hypothetical protein